VTISLPFVGNKSINITGCVSVKGTSISDSINLSLEDFLANVGWLNNIEVRSVEKTTAFFTFMYINGPNILDITIIVKNIT
jgi:hypothetical protein